VNGPTHDWWTVAYESIPTNHVTWFDDEAAANDFADRCRRRGLNAVVVHEERASTNHGWNSVTL